MVLTERLTTANPYSVSKPYNESGTSHWVHPMQQCYALFIWLPASNWLIVEVLPFPTLIRNSNRHKYFGSQSKLLSHSTSMTYLDILSFQHIHLSSNYLVVNLHNFGSRGSVKDLKDLLLILVAYHLIMKRHGRDQHSHPRLDLAWKHYLLER